MSKKRGRTGYRRHQATFVEHNGTTDENGQPTFGTESDWVPVVASWPVELVSVGGGETVRGPQVTAETTHVLYGEYFGGVGINAEQRCTVEINGALLTYNVIAARDLRGISEELRVDVKQET